MRANQTCDRRALPREARAAVAFLVVFHVEVGEDGRRGAGGEVGHVGGAELGGHGGVGEEEREGVADSHIAVAADQRVGGGGGGAGGACGPGAS